MTTIQKQAFLRWVAAAVVLVAASFSRHSASGLQAALWLTLLALVISAFFWPRCPHCKARVVQFKKRDWVPEPFCWRCGKPYDESETPAYEAELFKATEAALKVMKRDQAAGERILAEMERRLADAAAAEKATLRERAYTDPNAAKTLRNRLRIELKGLARTRQALKKMGKADPSAEVGLRNLDALEQTAMQELAALDSILSHK